MFKKLQNGANIILSIIPALNDKILRHNSELTSYINRLTSEKQDLRGIVSELQKAIAVLKDKEKRFNEVSLPRIVGIGTVALGRLRF